MPESQADNETASDKAPATPGRKAPKKVEVTLVHARGRDLGWTIVSGIIGALLLLKLGTLGQLIGVVLLALAALYGWRSAKTFMNAPGTFVVSDEELRIPTGLCAGEALVLSQEDLQQSFFLRRAVPFTKAGPLLVVEAKGQAYAFPRDWFASDSDQRRVASALRHRLEESA